MASLMMEPFLPAHLITPVKDRANSHCVVDLRLQKSLAEDVMCMQERVWDQYRTEQHAHYVVKMEELRDESTVNKVITQGLNRKQPFVHHSFELSWGLLFAGYLEMSNLSLFEVSIFFYFRQ